MIKHIAIATLFLCATSAHAEEEMKPVSAWLKNGYKIVSITSTYFPANANQITSAVFLQKGTEFVYCTLYYGDEGRPAVVGCKPS